MVRLFSDVGTVFQRQPLRQMGVVLPPRKKKPGRIDPAGLHDLSRVYFALAVAGATSAVMRRIATLSMRRRERVLSFGGPVLVVAHGAPSS